jgi:hypothetical protein
MTISINRKVSTKRDNTTDYSSVLLELTDEDIFREIWMLEEHIKYLDQAGDSEELEKFEPFLKLAKDERDNRFAKRGIN